MSLIDIFGVGKYDDTPEWDDSPFSLDYLSQGQNKYEPLGKHMDYEDYRDKERAGDRPITYIAPTH